MIKEKEIQLRINKKREYKNHKIKNKKEIKKRNILLVFLLEQYIYIYIKQIIHIFFIKIDVAIYLI
jgi:hypothetical protein